MDFLGNSPAEASQESHPRWGLNMHDASDAVRVQWHKYQQVERNEQNSRADTERGRGEEASAQIK